MIQAGKFTIALMMTEMKYLMFGSIQEFLELTSLVVLTTQILYVGRLESCLMDLPRIIQRNAGK